MFINIAPFEKKASEVLYFLEKSNRNPTDRHIALPETVEEAEKRGRPMAVAADWPLLCSVPERFTFFHQAFAEFECPLAILRKYGFVTKVLCFAVEPGEVVTAVVIHLKRIRGKQCLAMAEKELHPVLIALEERAIPEIVKQGLRYVHREKNCRLLRRTQRLAVVVVVQILEEEPLEEGAHLACDLAEVDRTT